MKRQYFTKDDVWNGGFYQLAIQIGPTSDQRLRTALTTIWSHPTLQGYYQDPTKEPDEQRRLDPQSDKVKLEGHLYGIAHLPNGIQVACGTCTVREENGSDWVDFYIPMGVAENDPRHVDLNATCPPWLGEGLRTAILNYIEQAGLTVPVHQWFSQPVQPARVAKTWLTWALADAVSDPLTAERRCVWIGGRPVVAAESAMRARIILPTRMEDFSINVSSTQAEWLFDLLQNSTPSPHRASRDYPRFAEARERFPRTGARGFDRFAKTAAWHNARQAGLLLV